MQGIIKNLNEKGFGFITIEGREGDLFFHRNDFDGDFDSLEVGQKVNCEEAESEKGPKAVNVTVVTDSE